MRWATMLFFVFIQASFVFAAPIDLQLGCRPEAMGGAFVAISDDVNALYWNPAGLVQIKGTEISFMRVLPFEVKEISINFLGVAQPLGPKGGVGISWIHKGATLKEGEDGKSSKMGENTFVLSSGLSLEELPVSLGINLKRLTLDSSLGGGAGFGADLGILYKYRSLSLGLMLRNLATNLKDELFDMTTKCGIGIRLFRERLILALDVNTKKGVDLKEKSYQYHFGMEGRIDENFTLRAGINKWSLSGGFGFRIKNLQFDSAYFKDNRYDLSYSLRFSLTMHL